MVRKRKVTIYRRPDREAFEASIWLGGQRYRPQLATFAEVDPLPEDAGARLLRNRYNEALERLLSTKPAGPASRERVHLSAAWDAFEQAMSATRTKGTLAYYARTKAEIVQAVGDPLLTAFSLRHVDAYTTYLRNPRPGVDGKTLAPLSIASTNIRLQCLGAFLRWCVERDYLDRAPRIRQLPKERRLPRVPNDEDVRLLLHRLCNPPHENVAHSYRLHLRAFMVAAGTGMRRSEVFYLRWEQVDFDEGLIRVQYQGQFRIKERREKNPPMPPFLATFLQAENDAKGAREVWLLDNGRGKLAFWGPSALTLAFRRHYDALGIPAERRPKAFHGFRALYATKLYNEMGVDIGTIRRLLGHSDVKTTEGYFADTRGEEKRAVAAYNLTATELPPVFSHPPEKPRQRRRRGK